MCSDNVQNTTLNVSNATASEESLQLKRRYSWQCRRGLKEVDVVLNAWLDDHFLSQTAETQQLFGQLLEEQDADLFEWFTERSAPEDAQLAALVVHILECIGKPR